jgi:hypothetical protein
VLLLSNNQVLCTSSAYLHFSAPNNYRAPVNPCRQLQRLFDEHVPRPVVKLGSLLDANVLASTKPAPVISEQDRFTSLGLSDVGISYLKEQQKLVEFNYAFTSNLQQSQFNKIISHANDLAAFNLVHKNYYELKNIIDESLNFTMLANNANRDQMVNLSQALLDVSVQLLAWGKGLAKGVYRNIAGVANMAVHPFSTCYDIGQLIYKTSCGLVRALHITQKAYTQLFLKYPIKIAQYEHDLSVYTQEWRQFYEHIKQQYANTRYLTKNERCELIGSLSADLLFMKNGGELFKLAKMPIQEVAIKSFSKLGEFGREVCRSVGYVLADGSKYLKQAGEVEIAAGEAGMLINIEEFLQKAPSILLTESQFATGSASVNKASKISMFEAGIAELAVKYGDTILNDAKQAFNLSEYKVLKHGSEKVIRSLDQLCSDIKKVVTSKPHRANFIYDAAHGNMVTENSIIEAIAACAAEDQGALGSLIRSVEESYDFIDEIGRRWDIKRLESKYIANIDFMEYVGKIKKGISNGEHVMIDISRAETKHVDKLKLFLNDTLSSSEISKVKIINY